VVACFGWKKKSVALMKLLWYNNYEEEAEFITAPFRGGYFFVKKVLA